MMLIGMPLIGTYYLYTGEDNEDHINGETYRIVETGKHWVKEFGTVVWVTSEEDKDTWDIDYCVSCSIPYFEENFWR